MVGNIPEVELLVLPITHLFKRGQPLAVRNQLVLRLVQEMAFLNHGGDEGGARLRGAFMGGAKFLHPLVKPFLVEPLQVGKRIYGGGNLRVLGLRARGRRGLAGRTGRVLDFARERVDALRWVVAVEVMKGPFGLECV